VTAVRLTLGRVAAAVDGTLRSGDPALEIGDVVIDSRSLRPSDFFVALRGPRFDAHAFVGDVLARGASGVLVDAGAAAEAPPWLAGATATDGFSPAEAGAKAGVIEVRDTLQALQDLAHEVRRAAGTKVVAITGSAGKTTTKETIAQFLGTRFDVVKNKGNLNNHIGLPLSLMQLRRGPDVAVMELGMNHAGEISALVAIAEPDVRVWINVGDAHLGFFESAAAIADAKGEILERADANTVLVCNADDARVMARAAAFPGRTLTFGATAGATIQASQIEDLGLRGMRARVATPAGAGVIETPLLGRGNLSNLLAATAVALEFGVALAEIIAAAARLRPADRRGAVQPLRDGVTLIDDSYNSSPAALQRALEVLAHETGAPRRIAVLGEMLELGDHAIGLHQACGRAAAASGLQLLIAVGGAPARALADAAVAAGMPARAVHYFETSDLAAAAAVAAIGPGDVVLVKGSRGVRTDIVADRLTAEFA
jgi:UDP-N-acetylmuramoyl-tripeptide--D-alanyl-D-alanine ligase